MFPYIIISDSLSPSEGVCSVFVLTLNPLSSKAFLCSSKFSPGAVVLWYDDILSVVGFSRRGKWEWEMVGEPHTHTGWPPPIWGILELGCRCCNCHIASEYITGKFLTTGKCTYFARRSKVEHLDLIARVSFYDIFIEMVTEYYLIFFIMDKKH